MGREGPMKCARRGPTLLAYALLLLISVMAPAPGVLGPAPPPVTVVLQPDGRNGTDTFIARSTGGWNFGDNASLWVGPDALNGSLDRSLLSFNLSALPAGAIVLNATLGLYLSRGAGGTIQAHRASHDWTEGTGKRSWIRLPVTVRETAGVRRTLEPVGLTIPFQPFDIENPLRDLSVFSGSSPVPSQVYKYGYSGGRISSSLVFLGVTIGPRQTRYFNITYSTNGTGVPSFRTRTWSPTPLWTFSTGATGESGASLVDLDGDGKLDVVFGTADGYVYALNETGKLKWATKVSTASTGNPVPWTPQVLDMDGDGKMDIVVVTTDSSVVRLNNTGAIKWTHAYGGGTPLYSTPTLIDVNGDGVLDVLVGGNMKQVDALNGIDGSLIRSYPTTAAPTFTASIKDIDGDGIGEIFFPADDKLVHAYKINGTQLWASAPGGITFIENSVAIGDVNGDGIPEVLTGDDANGGPEFALSALNGSVVWAVPTPNYREEGQTLADINGDGALEVLVPTTPQNSAGQLNVLRGKNGTSLWTYSGGFVRPMYPAIVDLNKDGKPEIVFLYGFKPPPNTESIPLLSGTGSLLYAWNVTSNDLGKLTISQKPMATPAVADLEGDGTMELVVPTGAGMYAFETGALGRDWRTWGYNWNHTHLAYDGNSPNGAPLLLATPGAPQVYPGPGASWIYRNGVLKWGNPGGDFLAAEANATAAPGWVSWNITSMVSDWSGNNYPNAGLFLTEADEVSGGLHGFYSSDAGNATLRPRLSITYALPYKDPTPRIIGAIPDQRKPENSPPWSINLASYAFDNDTPMDQLRWNVSGSNPAIVQITGVNTPGYHILTFYPQKNAWGNMRVTYWLTDPQGHYATQRAWINISFVNQPPTFNPPSTFIVHYDSTYTFNFLPYIQDVDDPPSNLTFTSDDARASIAGFNVSFLYPKSYLNQWVFVTLTVSDGQYSVARVVAVKVTSDNPPVVLKQLPDITMTEGQFLQGVFNLSNYFSDPDHDPIFFSFGYSHLNITIHANHSVDIRAQAEWWGQEKVTFRATDPAGAVAEQTILVTVVFVNDPPSFGPVPDLRVRYNESYSFNLDPYILDPDTPLNAINVSTSSPFITASGHLLTLLYPQTYNNTVQHVTIWMSDGTTTISKVIQITVGEDHPPRLTSKMPDRQFLEDTVFRNAYNLSSYFFDPDNSVLFYTSGNKNVSITIQPSNRVDLSALPNWNGVERVTFRATDPLGALAEDSVWITVIPVDDAPFFLPIPIQILNSTTAYLDLTAYLGDVDNNVSDLRLSTPSSNARILGQGILFTYQGDISDRVEVFASDGILSNGTNITVIVRLPAGPLPNYLFWLPIPAAAAALVGLALYRRREIDWALLATKGGLLVASVFRRGSIPVDTDQLTGMLTAIQDFASVSFSDEIRRQLEGLNLGDRRVTLVQGKCSYLGVVYRGRTPGGLPKLMKALLDEVEARYGDELKDFIDTSRLGDIPRMLEEMVNRPWWSLLFHGATNLFVGSGHRTK